MLDCVMKYRNTSKDEEYCTKLRYRNSGVRTDTPDYLIDQKVLRRLVSMNNSRTEYCRILNTIRHQVRKVVHEDLLGYLTDVSREYQEVFRLELGVQPERVSTQAGGLLYVEPLRIYMDQSHVPGSSNRERDTEQSRNRCGDAGDLSVRSQADGENDRLFRRARNRHS